MACRYTYKGKTYSADEFDDVLRAMPPMEAAKYMPNVESVPDAPFVGKTDSWVSLALKRAIRYAAENGYDRIAWTTGDQQNDRYDLSKRIDAIDYRKQEAVGGEHFYEVRAIKDGNDIFTKDLSEKDLSDNVGKDVADKIIKGEGDRSPRSTAKSSIKRLSGIDLRVGGEGMRKFYDQIVPSIVNKYVKKWGAKVGEIKIASGTKNRVTESGLMTHEQVPKTDTAVHSIDVTPQMKEAALAGQPLFSRNLKNAAASELAGILKPNEISPTIQAKVTALEKVGQGDFTITSGQLLDDVPTGRQAPAQLRIIKAVQETLKIPVALIATKGRFDFNGVYHQGTIWLNVDADVDALAIFGHELSHAMERDNPAAYKALMDAVRPLMKNRSEFESKYKLFEMSEAGIEKEMLGDIMGDRFLEPYFWQQVAAKTERSAFQKIASAIRQWLDRLLTRLKLRGLGSDRFVSDVEKAREIIADAVANYTKTKTGNSSATDKPEFSRAANVTGYRDRVRKIIQRLDDAMSPLGQLPDKKEYLKKRYLTLGRIAKVDEIAKDIRDVFKKATPEDNKSAYRYLTGEAQAGDIQNSDIRMAAERTKRNIEKVGDMLVASGLLSSEDRKANYLPRIYLRHLLDDKNVSQAIGTGKRPSDMGYLKRRKDIPEDVRRLILGEITDPAFLSATAIAKPMRDIALIDWLNDMATTKNEWIMPKSVVDWNGRKVSPFYLKDEAAKLRRQADHYTENDAKTVRDLAQEMERAADAALDEISGDHDDYQQIPINHKFGYMRGMFVRKEIYNDIIGSYELTADKSWPEKLFGQGGVGTKVTQAWKMMKVSLNPPAQIRNFVSNQVLLQLSGVPLHKIPVLQIRAVREISSNGKYWKIAKKYGVTESTFSAQELFKIRRDLLALEKASGNLSVLGHIKHVAAIVADNASDAYQFAESMGKTMKIIDAMEREGMNESDAVIEAQQALFDYSLVPPWVRYLRNAPVGAPFITFSYKVFPRLIETALLHPQRYAPWVALLYGLPYLFASMNDVGEDDWDKLKKAMPEWLQSKGHAMILPTKDDRGRWTVLDLGYFFPWTAFTEAGGSLAKGDPQEAVANFGLFGGPIPDLMTAWRTGKDPFTKRDIVKAGDPANRKAIAMLNYMWSFAAPPFLTDRGALGHAVRAYTGETDKYGEPRSTESQAAMRMFGVNIYALEPDKTRAQNIRQMSHEINDTKQALQNKLQDRSLSKERRENLVKEYIVEAKRRETKLNEYVEDSKVHQKLR